MSGDCSDYSCLEWFVEMAKKVPETELQLVTGDICAEEVFEDPYAPNHNYSGKTAVDEKIANSNAAGASHIGMYNNACHLDVPWNDLTNVFIYEDNGSGVGSNVSEEEHTRTQARFLSYGNTKEKRLHGHDLGRYGKGGVLNAQALCSSYAVVSRHKRDLDHDQYFICVKSFVQKRVHCSVEVVLGSNDNVSILAGPSGRKKFESWLERWTPIRLKHMNSLIRQLFARKDTGVSMLLFGMKQQVKREHMVARFSDLYWEPPRGLDNQPIPNFKVTYNGEDIPIQYACDNFVEIKTWRNQRAMYTNGFYPISQRDTTTVPNVQNEPKYIQSRSGAELEYNISVVKAKQPLYNPSDTNSKSNGVVMFKCGNHVIHIDLSIFANLWKKTTRYQLLVDTFFRKPRSGQLFKKLQQHCGAKSERFWRISKLGYDLTYVVSIPPWLLEVTKKTFVREYHTRVSYLLLSCFKTTFGFLCEYSHEIEDACPFKYLWGIDKTITPMLFQRYRTASGACVVPHASCDKYRIETGMLMCRSSSESEPSSESDSSDSGIVMRVNPVRQRPKRVRTIARVGFTPYRREEKRARISKRRNFHADVKKATWDQQNGRCANLNCCLQLRRSDEECDHKDGDSSNNEPSNCQFLCKTCHGIKSGVERRCLHKNVKFTQEHLNANSLWKNKGEKDLMSAITIISSGTLEMKRRVAIQLCKELKANDIAIEI